MAKKESGWIYDPQVKRFMDLFNLIVNAFFALLGIIMGVYYFPRLAYVLYKGENKALISAGFVVGVWVISFFLRRLFSGEKGIKKIKLLEEIKQLRSVAGLRELGYFSFAVSSIFLMSLFMFSISDYMPVQTNVYFFQNNVFIDAVVTIMMNLVGIIFAVALVGSLSVIVRGQYTDVYGKIKLLKKVKSEDIAESLVFFLILLVPTVIIAYVFWIPLTKLSNSIFDKLEAASVVILLLMNLYYLYGLFVGSTILEDPEGSLKLPKISKS
jgi:hypothetical protein